MNAVRGAPLVETINSMLRRESSPPTNPAPLAEPTGTATPLATADSNSEAPCSPTDAEKFCCAVLPTSGHLCIQPASAGVFGKTLWFSSAADAARAALELDRRNGLDVYLGMASYSSTQKRSAQEVAYKRALSLDIDVGDEKPFPNKAKALEALKAFLLQSGIPIPAILVDSGHGWHCHWPLSSDIEPAKWQILADNLRAACDRFDFPDDRTVTTDLARILRVPGTTNRKVPSEPREVRLHRCSEPHDPATLAIALEHAASKCDIRLSQEVGSNDLGDGIPSVTRWFDALPESQRTVELKKMLGALPDRDADDRDSWIRTLAEIASIQGVNRDAKINAAWEFSQRSSKSKNETRESVAVRLRGLGERTNVGALINRARQYGYEPPEHQPLAAYSDTDAAQHALAHQYTHVADADVYVDIQRGLILPKSSLKERESWRMPKRKSGGRYDPLELLRDSPLTARCDSFGYHPGANAVFDEDGLRLANLFRLHAPAPLKPTPSERHALRRFLRHLFPRGSDLVWLSRLLDTFAYLVRNPGNRVTFTMILVGAAEGSGKSTLMEEVPRLLFGIHNVRTVSTHELESNFTDYLARAWIIVYAEVSLGKSHRAQQIANSMKDNQTNSILRIIEKNRPGRSLRNRVSFFGTSNDETYALHLSQFDRRAGVCATPAPRMGDELAAILWNFLQSPRAAGVLCYLALARNVSRFDPKAAPPVTEAKRRMIDASYHPVHAGLIDAYEALQPPFDRDVVVLKAVASSLRFTVPGIEQLSERQIGEFLRAAPISAQRVEHQRNISSARYTGRTRIYVLKNFSFWKHASEKEISQHLETGAPPLRIVPQPDSTSAPGPATAQSTPAPASGTISPHSTVTQAPQSHSPIEPTCPTVDESVEARADGGAANGLN